VVASVIGCIKNIQSPGLAGISGGKALKKLANAGFALYVPPHICPKLALM